jgi:hypothetical protein
MGMPTILADHDVEGHLQVLLRIWLSPAWSEFWLDVDCEIESRERLGISDNVSDAELWRFCQDRRIIWLTGNRNAEGEDSLEATIRREGRADCLPVFTIADPTLLIQDRDYAELVAIRLIERLHELDKLCGAGRLYLP